MVHRGITLRVRPGSKAKYDKLMRIAGACRKVWNEGLEICERQWQDYRAGEADKPSVTFFSLCKVYVQVKQGLPWLGELPSHTVRYTMKHLFGSLQAVLWWCGPSRLETEIQGHTQIHCA